jgi:hypothetical protein
MRDCEQHWRFDLADAKISRSDAKPHLCLDLLIPDISRDQVGHFRSALSLG